MKTKEINELKEGDLINGVEFLRHSTYGLMRRSIFRCTVCNKEMETAFRNVMHQNFKKCAKCKPTYKKVNETLLKEIHVMAENSFNDKEISNETGVNIGTVARITTRYWNDKMTIKEYSE